MTRYNATCLNPFEVSVMKRSTNKNSFSEEAVIQGYSLATVFLLSKRFKQGFVSRPAKFSNIRDVIARLLARYPSPYLASKLCSQLFSRFLLVEWNDSLTQ